MRILVVGGGGFFGRRVVEELVGSGHFEVVAAARRLPTEPTPCRFERLDLAAPDLERRVAALEPAVVVNCAGPFRCEQYALVQAAIDAGSHYLDLAEQPAFVCGITRFDDAARRAGCAVLSGVSSVPALSSAVVADQIAQFARVEAIDMGISAPERPPGTGAVAGVLEQCGQPLPRAADAVAAWTDAFAVRWPAPVGVRVLARCDVPDLHLLPQRLPGLRRVTFRAGVASRTLMLGLRCFARLRRRGWFRNPQSWVAPLAAAARWVQPFPRGASGMFVRLFGASAEGRPLVVFWQLTAENHQGLRVPARGVPAMAERLSRGEVAAGARPCCMELSAREYLGADLPVSIQVHRICGDDALQDEVRWHVA